MLSKSIFWKQFILYFGTILVSFALLAGVMAQAYRGYFIGQREQLLERQAKRMADIFTGALGQDHDVIMAIAARGQIEAQINNIRDYMDTSVLFIDENFKVFMSTTDIPRCVGQVLNNKQLTPILQNQSVTIQGKLIDSFPTMMLSVAYPIEINNSIAGAVILNTPMPNLERTTSDVFKITVLGLLIVAGFTFILIYLTSRSITRTLSAVNEGAKVIANGDFEKRIEVKSRDEVGQLAESFNNMAESLERQDRLRREFISNISHDIRSPLTSMRGFLEAILEGTVPAEKTGHYLNIALEETDRLTKLANDILDLNKAQNQDVPLELTDFDINELIRKTVLMFEEKIKTAEIDMHISLDETIGLVNADYEKIHRVAYNLLDNAIKFTPKNGTIEISTEPAKNSDSKSPVNKVLVKVKDNGFGIDEENQKRVFGRFYKADSSRGEHKEGYGLGLSIVQECLKAHGEKITLTSKEGEGTEFIFTLTESK